MFSKILTRANPANKRIIPLFIALALLLVACAKPTPTAVPAAPNTQVPATEAPATEAPATEIPATEPVGEQLTMQISPETAECVGVGPQTCLIVRYNGEGDWQYFYQNIEGFEYEQGFEYELLVERFDVENPPADGSSLRYVLVEITSQVAVPFMEDALNNPLFNTKWNLIGYGDPDNLTDLLPGSQITLDFEMENASGSAGCNGYGSDYTYNKGDLSLNFGMMFNTEMACALPLMDQESAYLTLLQQVSSYKLSKKDTVLTLKGDDGILVYEMAEHLSLEGRTWQLTAIGDGMAMVSYAIDENINLTLQDGTATGSAGCNNFNGGYETVGNNGLTFGPLASTRKMCQDEVMTRENKFFEALSNVTGYRVIREELQLQDAYGTVLASFTPKENAMTTSDSLVDSTWDLVGYGDPNNLTPVLPDTFITLEIEADQLGGKAGCNGYGGNYTFDDKAFTIDMSGFMSTLMWCGDDIMEQERTYLDMLAKVETYTLKGETLTFHTPDGDLVYQVPPQLTLESNSWQLMGITIKDGFVSTRVDDKINITFENGNVSGSGGCNNFNSGYETTDENTLTFGPLMSTLMMCEEETSNRETEFFQALNQVASFTLTRDTLTLLDAEGNRVMSFRPLAE